MSQDFTEDSYDPDHVADTDMENQEKNDLALKSCFYGASSPANPTNGMLWADSGNGILKIYYNGWKNFFEFVNAYVYNLYRQVIAGTGLSGGGYLTADRTLNHAPHTGDVTGATELTIAAGAVEGSMLQEEELGDNNYFAPSGATSTDHWWGGKQFSTTSQSWVEKARLRIVTGGDFRFYIGYRIEADNFWVEVQLKKNGVVVSGPHRDEGTSGSDPWHYTSYDATGVVPGDYFTFEMRTEGPPTGYGKVWLRGTNLLGIVHASGESS